MPTTLVLPKAYQGDDYLHEIAFLVPELQESGIVNVPLAIDGTYTGNVKYGETLVPVDFSNSDFPGGILRFELTSEQTKDLPAEAVYDVQRLLNGKITTMFKGPFYTEPQVTP